MRIEDLRSVALPAASERPVVLILRHAARPLIPAGCTGAELAITIGGAAAAAELGAALGPRIASVRTSPVRRCVETAAALLGGAGDPSAQRSIAIVKDRRLGDPGVFIRDPQVAWEAWVRLGERGVLAELAAGGPAMPGFVDPLVASRRLVAHLLDPKGPTPAPGLHLAITHDALMIPLLRALLGRPLAVAEWPGYLEGIALWAAGAGAWGRWRATALAVDWG